MNGFNAGMTTPETRRPKLGTIFLGFLSIGMMSFGGGLAAWIRREVVQRRGWLDDPQFLSGYALSQLIPGATNVNLSVFIGTLLRGLPGALAALAGLTALPVGIVLIIGAIYLHAQGMPGGAAFSTALTGMGAVAIGLNLGMGIRLARRNIRRIGPAAITAVIALAIGVFGFKLLHVLLLMMPVSLVLAWWQGPEPRR
jgi:chromate transporter